MGSIDIGANETNLADALVLRKAIQLNNTCDLIVCGDSGEHLFVTSRGTNQFFDKREMLLGFTVVA